MQMKMFLKTVLKNNQILYEIVKIAQILILTCLCLYVYQVWLLSVSNKDYQRAYTCVKISYSTSMGSTKLIYELDLLFSELYYYVTYIRHNSLEINQNGRIDAQMPYKILIKNLQRLHFLSINILLYLYPLFVFEGQQKVLHKKRRN